MIQSVEELLRAAPQFHVDPRGRVVSGQLGEEVLLYLARRASAEWSTLEVGAGYSTLVLGMCGAQHTAITRSQPEVDAIKAFATANGIPLGTVRFIVESSDRALPCLDPHAKFDLILIDGSHAFPMPIVEWHYAAPLLKVGGLLLIDDLEVWAVRILRDFLRREASWHYDGTLCVGRTAVFRKAADQATQPEWIDQPYVAARSDLSLITLKSHPLPLRKMNLVRLARDVILRAVRTAVAYSRHLLDREYPPPFRLRRKENPVRKSSSGA